MNMANFANIRCNRVDEEILCTFNVLCTFSDIALFPRLSVVCQKIEELTNHFHTRAISVKSYSGISNAGDEILLSMQRLILPSS